MFEVGIKEADNQLTELEKRLKNIVNTYGKLELKVQVDGLKTFTSALENIGQGKGLEALQRRLDLLQVTLSNAGMAGVKSMQEFEAAVKVNSTVADQYRKRIEELTAARNKFIENTEPWRKANERLNSFQNDKNTLAIFAQEQVAIKNLEDAKTRLSNTNNQEAESYNKVVSSINTLNAAANTLKATLGSWDPNKGSIGQLLEQFEKLKNEIAAVASGLKNIDPAKLNFSGLNIDLGKVAGIGDLNTAIRGLEVSINEIINLFTRLGNAVKLDASSEIIKKLQADADAAQKTIQELTERMNSLAAAQKNVAETASKTGKSEKQISDSQAAMFNRYNKLLADIQNIKREIVGIQQGTGGGGPFGDKLGEYFTALNKIRNVAREITSSPSIADAITRGMSSEQLAKLNSALASLKTNYKEVISDAKDFNKATDKGSSQAEARIRKLGMAFNELKNYMKANGGSEEMKRLQTEIQGAIRKMRDLMNAGRFGEAVNVYERLIGVIRQAATATKEFERAQHSVSSTVSHTNSQLQGQSQILSDLKSMAMQYLSVWGAQSFINNIIELGGQLEQQRLSIGAILQDTAQANHLFGQIKDLAIKSPFGVQQLDAMTKQLSAYGFQYSELYEWTKRLADISAATGTSVDRLALALGHVRSEGALSGYTLRQFSMGNIPLLQKLSENLGKTKQEIRKMTRNKEIGYEDVLNVLKQLTDESGMFYQAQETMAQALNAKFKNLRDSFQIMYSEMAEGAPGDFLKGVAEVLTDISKSWRVLMPVVLSGGATLGVWKLSTMALNHELERSGKLLVGNAIATSKYSMNQLRAIATTGRWTTALHGLGRAMMSIGKFIFNPVTLGFAAVEGLIYLWSKHNDEVRKAKDLTKAYGEAAEESEKNISKQLEKIKPFSSSLDDSALKTGIDSMTEAIKNYAINGQSIINSMFGADSEGKVMSLADKYQYLRGELEETIKVYKKLKQVKDAFEYGITQSDGGWLDDNVETDLTQYADAYKKFVDDVTAYNTQYGNSIENAIKNAQNSDSAFREATKNMKSYGEMLAEFWSNTDKYKNAVQPMQYLFGSGAGSDKALNLNESFFGYLNKKNEAMSELDQFIENTETRLKEKGYDFSKKLAPEQVGALLKMSKDWLEKHPEWENIYDAIKEKLEGRWPIKIEPDAEAVPEQLSGWQQEIQDWLDEHGLKIQISPTDSHEDFIKKVKSLHEAAQTAMDNSGKVLIGIGFKLDNLPSELPSSLATPWNQSNLDTYNEKKSTVDAIEQLKKKFNFSWKEKGGNKGSKKSDEKLKEWREDLKELQAFWQEYEKLFKRMSSDKAIEEIRKNGVFPSLFDSKGNLLVDVRGGLSKALNALLAKTDASTTERETLQIEIKKLRFNVDQKAAEEAVAITINEMQEYLSKQAGKFDLYKSLLEKTGNKDFAMKAFSDGRVWDELSIEFADELKTAIEDAGQEIDVAELWDMTDAKAKEHLKNVAGGYELWKKIVELTSNKYKKSLEDSANALAKSMTYEQRIAAIRERYKNMGYLGESDDEAYARNRDMNAEIAQVEFDKLKDEINWDAVFGNMRTYTKKALLDARRAIKEYLKLNRQNMGVDQIKDAETAINNLNEAIADKSGLFSGMSENMQEYIRAVEELTKAEKNYQTAVDTYGANSIQAQDARKKVNQAQNNVVTTQSNVKDSGNKTLDKLAKLSQSLITLGKKEGASLSEVGGVVSTLITTLGSTNTGLGNLIAAIFSLLDSLGNDPMGFAENLGKSIGNGLYGVNSLLNPVGNIYKDYHENHKIFGDNWFNDQMVDMYTMAWMKSADWYDYEKIKASYESLLKVWDELLSKKKAYLDKSWGTEAQQAADQAISLLQSEREIAQILGREVLGAGSSMWSHTIGYRMWQGSYDFEGKNWRDVANEISRALGGVKFSEMADMLDMTSEQLIWIKENYTGLWSQMDDDFKGYLEQLIEYGDIEAEILDKVKEKLTGWNTDAIKTEWADLMSSMDNSSDALADNLEEKLRKAILNSMMENLFVNKIQKLIDSATTNDLYLDKNGNVKHHQYDANGNIMDTDVASEFTQEELSELVDQGQGLAEEVTAIRDMLKERYGWTDKDSSSSSSSNTIKGITEQTADLIASYLNAIRADVSVIREMEGKAVLDYWPDQIRLMTSGTVSLRNIENHTAAIMRSNDTIASSVSELQSDIRGLKNRAWKMPIG